MSQAKLMTCDEASSGNDYLCPPILFKHSWHRHLHRSHPLGPLNLCIVSHPGQEAGRGMPMLCSHIKQTRARKAAQEHCISPLVSSALASYCSGNAFSRKWCSRLHTCRGVRRRESDPKHDTRKRMAPRCLYILKCPDCQYTSKWAQTDGTWSERARMWHSLTSGK